MKLQKILKAFTSKSIYIVTEEGGNQWIGDGHAFYVVDSGLDLTSDNVLAILDVEEDKRDTYNVYERDDSRLPMCDICPQEMCDEALHPIISISWALELITIFKTDNGEAVAVKQKQIAPAEGKEKLAFYLRKSVDKITGEVKAPVVAVFQNMLCSVVIQPIAEKTIREIWELMRIASDRNLIYCIPPEEGESK